MIRVDDAARRLIGRLLSEAGASAGGVRIALSRDEDQDGFACEFEVADQPEVGDVVVETKGVRLFLGGRAADELDDAELVVEQGELALALHEAAGCGDT